MVDHARRELLLEMDVTRFLFVAVIAAVSAAIVVVVVVVIFVVGAAAASRRRVTIVCVKLFFRNRLQ